jgi:diguanylate cyclase (GGDEF)-like protein
VQLAGAEVGVHRSDSLLWAAIPASQRSKITGAIHLPVVGPRGPRAVIALALSSSSMEFDRESLEILRLLAGDAALAMEREDSNRLLAEQANRDPLTGLVNRRILDQAVNRALASFDGGLAFALLDIDHFKAYNDAHGHQAGDRVLVVTAGTWSRLIRPEDTLARFGGEEFALVMPGCALAVAEGRITVMRSSLPPPVTASAGLTSARPGDSYSDIVARADLALYRAKAAGRDRTVRG